jgi:hypothetical protein
MRLNRYAPMEITAAAQPGVRSDRRWQRPAGLRDWLCATQEPGDGV